MATPARRPRPAAAPSPDPAPSAAERLAAEEREERYKPLDRALVRRLLGLLAPYKGRYALGIGLGTGMVLLEMQSPRFIGAIITTVEKFSVATAETGGPARTAFTTLGPATAEQAAAAWRVASIVGLWALALLGAVALQRAAILVMTAAGERVQFDIRKRLFAHLQAMSMSYYDRTKLGRVISRCTSDVNSLREVNVWGINTVWLNGVQIVVAAASLAAFTDWRLFLSVAWLGPILFALNAYYRRRAGLMWQEVREGFTRVSTNLAENITGVRVVTAFNRQGPNLNAFNALQEDNTANNVRTARINGVYQPTLQVIGFLGKAIILLYGGYLVVAGPAGTGGVGDGGQRVGVGAVVAAFLYWDWFMNPILNFGNFSNQLLQAMAGAERVFGLLDSVPDVADVPGAPPLPTIRGEVTFDRVTFGYHADRPVLHDVSFTCPAGATFALVGATGSGKSSIISLIARFYRPQVGRVLVDGHDLGLIQGDSLHHQIGLVLQANYLFTGTVMENVRYARPDATDEQVHAAARALGTHEAIRALQDGYDTDCGERGGNMSLGQRQLICFTRAFLADPRVFMLDEATSAVDTATEHVLQRSLDRLTEGRTTFIVAHRLSTVKKADRILVIDHGRIVEQGGHDELVAAGGRYAHLYEQFVEHAA